MVHPPFAWQLASFPSLPVCGEEAPYCPLRDFATLRTYSPEIKARQALFAFLPVYPELVGVVGWNVPNYQECSSGDTVAKPAITMALLATGAPDSVNFRAMGYVKFPPHFRQGAARNRRSIRELWSHRRTGVRLEIWGNRKPLLGWDRFLCFSRYSGCW